MASFKVKNGIEATTVLERLNSPSSVSQNGLGAPSVTGSALTTALSLGFNGRGYKFKPDGTRFWHSDNSTISVFYQYDLSTAWDLSTAGTPSTASPTGQRLIKCFVFKPDGTKLYVIRDYSTNVILEYDVATAWDITSTLTLVNTLTVLTELPSSILYNLHFSSDGTKMIGIGVDNYAEYTLSTAWDISTATVANTGTTGSARAYSFTDDGTEAYYVEGQDIYKATLSTAWDTTTLSAFTKQGTFSSTVAYPATFYKKDATTGFILDASAASSFKEINTTYNEITIDLSKGNKFKVTLNTGAVIAFTNPPPAGKVIAFSLEISDAIGNNINWGNSMKWEVNSVPTHSSGKSLYAFIATSDGTIYGRKAGSDFQ
jgi:hypothetical protein